MTSTVLLIIASALSPQRPELPGAAPRDHLDQEGITITAEEMAKREAASARLYRLMFIGVGGVTLVLGGLVWMKSRRASDNED